MDDPVAAAAAQEDVRVRLIDALRDGIVPPDLSFDSFMPRDLRRVSYTHWTPLIVALRVAQLLDAHGVRHLVDIGSGAGKFCVATALAGHFRVTGLEQRPRLVAFAGDLARRFEVETRVDFVAQVFPDDGVPAADAYYLYNPFGENLFSALSWIDPDVELTRERFDRDVAATTAVLAGLPVGTLVVTYNGFGGTMPASFEAVQIDRDLPAELELWRQGGG